ncbi:putative NACHT domain-containing protein [Seiridium cardinale]
MDCLNRHDILLYVTGEFEGNTHFAKLQEKQPAFASQLMRDIVQKSAAVFFWVYLVVHSLLRGLSNSDRISDLQHRLNELPSELEALFEKILSNLEPFYYTHACQLFQIFEGYNEVVSKTLYIFEEPLDLSMSSLAMSFADDNDLTAAFIAEVKALSLKESNNREEEIRRRLNSCCQGLLEASESTTIEDMVSPKARDLSHSFQPVSMVRYLHRTTRDFIRKPRTWREIVIATGPSFDPFILISNSALYQLKTLKMSLVRPNHLTSVVRSCFAVSSVRSKDPIFTAKYLDEVEKTERSLVQQACANGQSLVNKQPGDSTEQIWTSDFTAYRVPSLLDFAITTPPEFLDRGNLGTAERKDLHAILSPYACSKVQSIAPLDMALAEYWLEKCDQERVKAAIKKACPSVEKASQTRNKQSGRLERWFKREFKSFPVKGKDLER